METADVPAQNSLDLPAIHMSPSIRKLPDSRTSSEEAAASTRISPCSIFHFMSWSKKASWLVCKVKASRFFSPGSRWTRAKPASSLTGRVILAYTSEM